jgi:hypothetical protein
MRTAIYVHKPSTITIQTTDPRDASLMLCRYPERSEPVAAGTRRLDAGIYLLLSHGEVTVTGDDTTVVQFGGDKDIPPEPRLVALASGASRESILKFFAAAKGISVGPPTAPSPTSKITNDPDGI